MPRTLNGRKIKDLTSLSLGVSAILALCGATLLAFTLVCVSEIGSSATKDESQAIAGMFAIGCVGLLIGGIGMLQGSPRQLTTPEDTRDASNSTAPERTMH